MSPKYYQTTHHFSEAIDIIFVARHEIQNIFKMGGELKEQIICSKVELLSAQALRSTVKIG
jgi:hypothetical protein